MKQAYETIKKLTRAKGITLENLEEAVGAGKGTIKNWADHAPSVLTVKKVADFLGVTVDDLLKEE